MIDPDRPVRIDRYLEGTEVDVDAISDGEDVLIPGLLEHVEQAGVHSGDSVGIFPPQTVSAHDQALIVATMERIVRALGARGLVNAQFIVRDDGVYLIEVNPRASRTVPFLSKVTGVPMVELAVRVALGERLRDLGWPGGLLAAAAARRGQGPGVLDGQAPRRRPVGRAGDAVDRRGDRPPPRRPGGAGEGAGRRGAACRRCPGRRAALALHLDCGARQGPAAAPGDGARRARAIGSRRPRGRPPRFARSGFDVAGVAKVARRRRGRCPSSTSSARATCAWS